MRIDTAANGFVEAGDGDSPTRVVLPLTFLDVSERCAKVIRRVVVTNLTAGGTELGRTIVPVVHQNRDGSLGDQIRPGINLRPQDGTTSDALFLVIPLDPTGAAALAENGDLRYALELEFNAEQKLELRYECTVDDAGGTIIQRRVYRANRPAPHRLCLAGIVVLATLAGVWALAREPNPHPTLVPLPSAVLAALATALLTFAGLSTSKAKEWTSSARALLSWGWYPELHVDDDVARVLADGRVRGAVYTLVAAGLLLIFFTWPLQVDVDIPPGTVLAVADEAGWQPLPIHGDSRSIEVWAALASEVSLVCGDFDSVRRGARPLAEVRLGLGLVPTAALQHRIADGPGLPRRPAELWSRALVEEPPDSADLELVRRFLCGEAAPRVSLAEVDHAYTIEVAPTVPYDTLKASVAAARCCPGEDAESEYKRRSDLVDEAVQKMNTVGGEVDPADVFGLVAELLTEATDWQDNSYVMERLLLVRGLLLWAHPRLAADYTNRHGKQFADGLSKLVAMTPGDEERTGLHAMSKQLRIAMWEAALTFTERWSSRALDKMFADHLAATGTDGLARFAGAAIEVDNSTVDDAPVEAYYRHLVDAQAALRSRHGGAICALEYVHQTLDESHAPETVVERLAILWEVTAPTPPQLESCRQARIAAVPGPSAGARRGGG